MKINSEKIRKAAIRTGILVGVILVAVYVWEYKCALMRPATGCSSLCENKEYIVAYAGNDALKGHICIPWYYRWMGK